MYTGGQFAITGVTIEDFQVDEPELPFTREICKVGFPREDEWPGIWIFLEDGFFDEFTLLKAINGLQDSPIRAQLADRLLNAISLAADRHQDRKTGDYLPFRSLLKFVCPPSALNLSTLAVLFPESIDGEWVEVLDRLGRGAFWYIQRRPLEKFAGELWKTFMANPMKVGLISLLAELSADTRIPEIPFDYLDPAKIDDPRLKAAAIIVLLTQKAGQSRCVELAQHAVALDTQLRRFVAMAARVLRERQLEGEFSGNFFLELLRRIPSSQFSVAENIVAGLDDIVRSRQSHLDEASTWNELKLPTLR